MDVREMKRTVVVLGVMHRLTTLVCHRCVSQLKSGRSSHPSAPVHLQRQHPGGRVLHADPVERPPHLLRQQQSGR